MTRRILLLALLAVSGCPRREPPAAAPDLAAPAAGDWSLVVTGTVSRVDRDESAAGGPVLTIVLRPESPEALVRPAGNFVVPEEVPFRVSAADLRGLVEGELAVGDRVNLTGTGSGQRPAHFRLSAARRMPAPTE